MSRRRIAGLVGVVSMSVGLIGIAPAPVGAFNLTADVTCVGANQETQTLLDTALGGSIQIAGSMEVDVPTSLAPGQSAPVSFAVEMKPDQEMIDLSTGVGITAINGTVQISVDAVGGSGGPFTFPSSATISIDPPNFPVLVASGTVTAGDGPITYVVNLGQLNFQTVGGIEVALALNCSIPNPNIAVTAVGADGGGGGSSEGAQQGSGASTTLAQGTTGTASSKVTG